MRFKTVDEAAHQWVNEMNAYPVGMISKLWMYDPSDWDEVTAPTTYDRAYVHLVDDSGEIIDVDRENDEYTVMLDNGNTVTVSESDIEVERESDLPMWSWLWSFSNGIDEEWLERGGIEKMSDCGFRVYNSGEFGYFFGIDGAGYDFYHEHWIPLYHARGLRWADEQYKEGE